MAISWFYFLVLPLFAVFAALLDLSYWIKRILTHTAIRIYNARHRRRFDLYDAYAFGDPVKLGFVAPQLERDLEAPFPESHLRESADEILFYGVNSKTECLLVRIARGSNQIADAWIYLKLANGKTYHHIDTTGFEQPFDDKCQNFSCGQLQMHYLAPMRRWRIFFCGMLKELTPDNKDTGKVVFVKFVFLWKASSEIYDFTFDTNPKGIADAIASSEWNSTLTPPINSFLKAVNFYCQSGVVTGTVSVNDDDEYEMYLFGEKMRNLGSSASIVGCKFTHLLGNTPKSGLYFHLSKATAPRLFKNLSFGFEVQTDGNILPIKDVDINIEPLKDKDGKKKMKASFFTNSKFDITGSIIGEPIVFHSGQGWSGHIEVAYVEFEIDGKKGSGLFMSGELTDMVQKPSKMIYKTSFPDVVPLTVPFTDDASHFGEISGGKGSSLGKLTGLSKQEKTFTVPKGIIVTTSAYEEFLTPEILKAVKKLENVIYGNIKGDLKENCSIVSDIIVKSPLPTIISHNITEDLKRTFKGELSQYKFAVRSSATGEDTAAMSAAGQMDTFLGVQGLDEIFIAVKKCWASQFGHIAVEYKRRNGQILNSPMAVVIQEMVACEVSGVLFTCDPVNNNPSIITITANYGLGETVVSGSVEPDTITLRRVDKDDVQFDSVLVGKKHQKIIMQESGGTITEDIPEDSRSHSCISKEIAERLGRLAIKIERYYKSSRDIEWGFLKNDIYILQSRPVTNIAAETDAEIKHEFDAPLRCEGEYFSVANVGEVMPGATSPLGLDLVMKFFSNVLKKEAMDKGQADNFMNSKYCPNGMLPFYNHVVMTVAEMLTRFGDPYCLRTKGIMVSIFGRVLDDPELLDFANEKMVKDPPASFPSLTKFLRENYHYYWDLFLHDKDIDKIRESIFNYHLDFLKTETADEAFTALLNSCSDFDRGVAKHITSSAVSSEWNMFIFDILCKAKGCFDNDVYSDFALLLATSSNVESANVPLSIQELAIQIVKDINCEEFKAMSLEEAVNWLQTTNSQSGVKFQQFLKRHGHRCLKEFDVKSITWGMDPKLLVTLLQTLAGVGSTQPKGESEDDNSLLSNLTVPLDFWNKLRMRFVLPNCRKAIRGREAGKSLTIKTFDHWRKGYRHLAKLMVSEGRIPEAELIFFMTLDEIENLLKTRSPSIISRANYRKRMYATLDAYKFPEIMKGSPKPMNDENESAETYEFIADLSMKGIPVSQGVTKGYARVAMNLEEASHLKPGEILITYSTDIGWSPYFPIISGVVTELGGLISHGAVVSREYGLPCVVGLEGATKKFFTGDYVLLDGKKGILQRLPKPEE